MKFTIQSESLAKMAGDLFKAVPAKPVTPILQNFLAELSNGLLRLTASNGETTLRGLLKPDSAERDGKACVPARILIDLLRTLPAGAVTFESANDASMSITWGSGRSSLPLFPPEDYPSVATPPKDAPRLQTTSETLSAAIGKTVFAASSDQNHPALCGILFDLGPGTSSIVASDSAKLVCHSFKSPDVEGKASFILPTHAAVVLKTILPRETNVNVIYGDRVARFTAGSVEMLSRLVEARFPDYRKIIPSSNENIINVNREKLLATLKRMAVVAEKKTPIVKVDLDYNTMTLSSEDPAMSVKGSEKLEVDYDGAGMMIGLKVPTMVETLSNIESESVEIRLKDDRRAVLIQPSENGREEEPYEAVLMPYKIR